MPSLAKKSMNFMRDVYALANEHANGALPTTSSKPSSSYRPSSSLSSQFSHHLNHYDQRPANRPSTSYSPNLSPSPQVSPEYGQPQPVHQIQGAWSTSPASSPSPVPWSQTPIQSSASQSQSPALHPNQGPPPSYQSPSLPLPSPTISPSSYHSLAQSPGNQSHYFQPPPSPSYQAYSPPPPTHQIHQTHVHPSNGPPVPFTALPPSPILTPSPCSPPADQYPPQMIHPATTTWTAASTVMELPGSSPKPPPLPRRDNAQKPPFTTSSHIQSPSHFSSSQQSPVELPALHISGPDSTSVYYEMPAEPVQLPSPSHGAESLLVEHPNPNPSARDSRHGSNHSITTLDDIHALDGKAFATELVTTRPCN